MGQRIKMVKKVFPIAGILFLLTVQVHQPAAMEDAILAIVNAHVITIRDLEDYLTSIYRQLLVEGKTPEQAQEILKEFEVNGLNRLIEDKLILDTAKKKGLEVRARAIDERIEEIKKKYISEEEFMKALISDGSTMNDLRKRVGEQLAMQYVVDLEVHSKIFVNPQEVTDYYTQHQEEFKRPPRVNLDSIFIPFGNDPQTATAKAGDALTLLEQGQDFAEVARQFSTSPSIGLVTKGQLMAHIETIVFNLEPLQISKLVETDSGIFIFKLREKLPAETIPLETVKKGITNMLFQQKFRDRYQRWIEDLKKDAYVEIKQ